MSDIESQKPLTYEVFFSYDSNVTIKTDNPYLLISTDKKARGWNDFGHKIRYTFVLIDPVHTSLTFDDYFFLSFVNGQDSASSIIDNLKPGNYVSALELPQFFSLLTNMGSYRALVESVEPQHVKHILLALNDLVAAKYYPNSPSWVNTAVNTEAFKLAFVRESESFFAFHNASSLFNGVNHEGLQSMTSDLSLDFKLDGFSNKHEFEFTFDHGSILPKRINIIIGKNGLGKSQALSSIVKSLLKGSDNLSGPNNTRPMINRLLALGTPGETANSFPRESETSRVKYRRLSLTRNSHGMPSRGFGELIVQLVRSEEIIGVNTRWQIFLGILKKSLPIDSIVLKLDNPISALQGTNHIIKASQGYYIAIPNLSLSGEKAQLSIWGEISPNLNPFRLIDGKTYPLSSGQLAFLQFAVQASLFIENGTLVLLDEPETHLHPNLITSFVLLLDNLLKLTGSLAILATHSAYFVREITSGQVNILKESESNVISILRPGLKTFGANVGAISHFVFEDELESTLTKEIDDYFKDDANTASMKIELFESLTDDLSIEALMILKDKYLVPK